MAEDIKIQCAEKGCTEVRIFTVKDQVFYAEKGFSPPKRCRTHSQAKRRQMEAKEQERDQDDRDHRGYAPKMPGQEDDRNVDW